MATKKDIQNHKKLCEMYPNLTKKENPVSFYEMKDKISEKEVSPAIHAFLDALNLGSGSQVDFDIYSVIYNYMLNEEKRQKINKAIRE